MTKLKRNKVYVSSCLRYRHCSWRMISENQCLLTSAVGKKYWLFCGIISCKHWSEYVYVKFQDTRRVLRKQLVAWPHKILGIRWRLRMCHNTKQSFNQHDQHPIPCFYLTWLTQSTIVYTTWILHHTNVGKAFSCQPWEWEYIKPIMLHERLARLADYRTRKNNFTSFWQL